MNAWNKDRGFGFIRQDVNGPDAFAHISEIAGAVGDIVIPDGTRVEYDIADSGDPDKPKAVNIVTLDWSPKPLAT